MDDIKKPFINNSSGSLCDLELKRKTESATSDKHIKALVKKIR